VLLARRDRPPIWNLPGGGVEPGEAPWDAAVRETREEVGVEVAIRRLTGVYHRPPGGDPVRGFTCDLVAGTPTTRPDPGDGGRFAGRGNRARRGRVAEAVRPGPATVLVSQPGPSVRELFPD